MDSVSHLLLGHVMGIAAAKLGVAHADIAYWSVLVGNSLPDVDVPVSLLLRRNISLHRTFTHTIPGAIVLSLAAALIIVKIHGGGDLGTAFLWTLIGTLAHIGLDALNLFGIRLTNAFSRPVAVGALHIMDPILLGIWAMTATANLYSGLTPAVPVAALGLSCLYIAYRICRARQIRRTLRRNGALRADVIPWYVGWHYVAETPDRIEVGRWHFNGPEPMHSYPKPDASLMDLLGHNSALQAFLATASYPYAIVHDNEVMWGCALRQVRADYHPLRMKLPLSHP